MGNQASHFLHSTFEASYLRSSKQHLNYPHDQTTHSNGHRETTEILSIHTVQNHRQKHLLGGLEQRMIASNQFS